MSILVIPADAKTAMSPMCLSIKSKYLVQSTQLILDKDDAYEEYHAMKNKN